MNLDLSYYFSVFLRRIYVIIILGAGAAAASIYVAMELPATYRAQARLLVESPQIPSNLAASTVQVDANEQLQIIEQRLLTRDNLLRIARELDVFANMDRMTADEIVSEMSAATSIRRSSGQSQATLMTIAFSGKEARTTAGVVNEYVTRILEENRRLRTALAEDTFAFFEQEVNRLSAELALQSDRIVDFKRQNSDALPTSLEFRQDRQTSLQERLNQIQRELTLIGDQEERLKSVFESGGDIAGEQELSPDARRLQQLKSDLDSALALYSPTNPRIRLLQAQIKQVEDKILASADSEDADPHVAPADPRAAMLELQLAELGTRRDYLLEQRTYIEEELDTLAEAIAKTPEVTVAIDSLERNYANIQSQYDQAVARLATAATGERIELLSKGERMTVIEQASVPTSPSSPNRPLIAGAGTIAGLGLGAGLILLLEVLSQSIRRPVDLERRLGVTPIATLPYIRTRREVLWKRLVLIAIMAVVIIGGPAVIFLIHTYFMPIDMLIERGNGMVLR